MRHHKPAVEGAGEAVRNQGLFSDFYRSVFDIGSYRHLKDNPVRRALLLVFLVSLVVISASTALSLYGPNGVMRFIDGLEIPSMRISNGTLYSDAAQPFIIYESINESVIVVLDTADSGSFEGYRQGIVIGSGEITVRDSGQSRSFSISQFGDVIIGRDYVRNLFFWITVGAGVAVLLFGFLWNLVYVTFFSFAGMLFNSFMGLKLYYRSVWVVGAYALVPSIVLGFAFDLLGIGFAFGGTVIYLLYLCAAFISLR